MSDAPERIFLQDAGDYARAAAFEVTWCVEPQDDADTEYIRADRVAALVEKNARLRDAVAEVDRLRDALTSVLSWHDKDKHASGKMTFERSAAFAKARAALAAFKGGAQ